MVYKERTLKVLASSQTLETMESAESKSEGLGSHDDTQQPTCDLTDP